MSSPGVAVFSSLSGRRAVVTGASSGIGRATALEFARAGSNLVVHCRGSRAKAEGVARDCRGLGVAAEVRTADLRDVDCLETFVEETRQTAPVDIWVNNAGADILTGDGPRSPFLDKLAALYETDVRATLILSRVVGSKMKSRGQGVILNIGWDQADRGMEGDSGELFAATKNAVMGFTRSLALSLAPQVRVNCLAPGWIRTAWGQAASQAWQDRVLRETPLQRWGTPEDIAHAARFLCGDQAAFITGQVIAVNGGAVR